MIAKYLATAMIGTALIGSAAFAQSTMSPATADRAATAAAGAGAVAGLKGSWRASKLVGLAVYNDSNERLGDINEILVDNSGRINAVILGVGGFLGVGEQNIAVSFDKLRWVNEPVRSASANAPGTVTAPSTVGSAGTASAARDSWYPDHAVMSGTKDQLKALPAFKYSDYSK